MTNVTQILSQIEQGDPSAADQLLPLVYEKLRKLATARLAQEDPGQTLQAAALVHDAYLRLVDADKPQHWNGRGHFFAAAAEAMRRILVENARRKKRMKHGGEREHIDIAVADPGVEGDAHYDLLALEDALTALASKHPKKAELVKLRFFGGLTLSEAAEASELAIATADRYWKFARAWLARELRKGLNDGDF